MEQGGVTIDGEKAADVKASVTKEQIGEDGIILKRGKKKFIKVICK